MNTRKYIAQKYGFAKRPRVITPEAVRAYYESMLPYLQKRPGGIISANAQRLVVTEQGITFCQIAFIASWVQDLPAGMDAYVQADTYNHSFVEIELYDLKLSQALKAQQAPAPAEAAGQ